jgi:hypothetical protein
VATAERALKQERDAIDRVINDWLARGDLKQEMCCPQMLDMNDIESVQC